MLLNPFTALAASEIDSALSRLGLVDDSAPYVGTPDPDHWVGAAAEWGAIDTAHDATPTAPTALLSAHRTLAGIG